MLRIQWKYVFVQDSGTNLVRPCSTASMAGFASGSIFTNHCGDRRGSTTVALRWHVPTDSLCGSSFSSRPCSWRSASTCLRASKRSMPAYLPVSFVIRAASSRMDSIGSL